MSIDRKALVRQYKETPRTMGVAVVRNTQDDKAFVMAGADIPSLINRHRAQLRMGGHPNKALQRDYSALGEGAFTFEIVDTLTPPDDPTGYDGASDLTALEAMWMEKLAPYEPAGYHRRPKES
jgi:hypothetical protein